MQKIFIVTLLLLFSCQQAASDAKSHKVHEVIRAGERKLDFRTYEIIKFALPSGRLVEAFNADTLAKQTQGLSGVREGELKVHQGMLFTYPKMDRKQFWMPNTYMNLDIYFMDGDYRVIHVDRSVPAHPSMEEPVPRSSIIFAQNILEIPSSSPYAGQIKKGMTLKVIN